MKVKFGQWLKEQIDMLGITQAELANRIGLQPPQVSRMISGERGTSIEVLEAIARVLRVSPDVVFKAATGEKMELDKTAIVQQIDYIINDLPKEEQENILAYARLRQRLAEERGIYRPNEQRTASHPGASQSP